MPGPFPDVPHTLRFTLKGHDETGKWQNIFHWDYTGSAPSSVDCAAIAGDFGDVWNTDVLALTSTNSTLDEVECIDLTSRTSGSGVGTGTWVGAHTESVMPASTALLWHWHAGVRYRGGHPRTYIAGMTADRVLDNTRWSTTTTGIFDGAQAAFVGDANALGAGGTSLRSPVLVRVNHAPDPPVLLGVFDLIAGGTEQRICTQRRRNGKLIA